MKIELQILNAALRGRLEIALTEALRLVTESWHDPVPFVTSMGGVGFATTFLGPDDNGMKEEKVARPWDTPDAALFSLYSAMQRGCNLKKDGFVPFTPTCSPPRSGDVMGFVIENLAADPEGSGGKSLNALRVDTTADPVAINIVNQAEAIRVLTELLRQLAELEKVDAKTKELAAAAPIDAELEKQIAGCTPKVRELITTLREENARLKAAAAPPPAAPAVADPSKPAEATPAEIPPPTESAAPAIPAG